MAIVWGATSNHLAVGIEVTQSPATVTAATSSVTLTYKIYFRNDQGWYYYAHPEITLSNALSEVISVNYDVGATSQVKLMATRTLAVPTSYAAAVTKTLTARVSGIVNVPTSATVTVSTTVAKRPASVPSPPTNFSVTRAADNKINMSWTRASNAGAAATAWSNVVVQRSTDGGGWTTIGTLPGTSTTWADSSTTANHRYMYRIASKNSAGQSAWVQYGGSIWTTPATPTSVRATKQPGGTILVRWTDNSPANTGWDVQDSPDGVNWTTLITDMGLSTYVHASPSTAVTHRYRVRSRTENGLVSAWSTVSNVVQLLSPPGAPTNLSPNGAAVPVGQPVTIDWEHVAIDSSEQTAYEFQWRVPGVNDSWVTSGKVTSSQSSGQTVAAQPEFSGTTFEWQVRTWGLHADPSPWSAVATFTIWDAPQVTLLRPSEGEVLPGSNLSVTWEYFQANGQPQSAYVVTVTDAATGEVVAQRSGSASGTQTSVGLVDVLENGKTYQVAVAATSSSGLTSNTDTATITVEFVPPANPSLSVQWQAGYGYNEITGAAQDEAGKPETVRLELQRSNDGGATWVTLVDTTELSVTYLDWTASMRENTYRLIAYSDLPSQAETVVQQFNAARDAGDDCGVYLSGGPGMTVVARLGVVTQKSLNHGRERVLNQFEGRSAPTETSGEVVETTFSVSGILLPEPTCAVSQATLEEFIALFSLPGPHLLRFAENSDQVWCSISDLSADMGYLGQVGFTATRADVGSLDQIMPLWDMQPPRITEIRPGEYVVIGGTLEQEGVAQWSWRPYVG